MTDIFRLSEPRAKNLLIINKGPGAVEIPREGKAWDLLEIYFKPSQIEDIRKNPAQTDAEHIVFESDRLWRKFRIMKKVFQTSNFWQAYESIMFADDDLIPVGCTIADIFELFKKTGCRVGQPALTQDSYFYWMTTLKNNNFVWRKTNFVEVMCPILTPDAIRDYLPVFDATITHFGLDFYWGYHEMISGHGTALLDSTPMRHCRPIGEANPCEGLESPYDEFLQFMKKYGIPFYSHLCLGGQVRSDLNDAYVHECTRIGLAFTGYDDKFLDNPKFLSSYGKREIAAFHEKFKNGQSSA